MIQSEEQNNYIIKAIVSSASKSRFYSFTDFLNNLNKVDSNLYKEILTDYDEIYSEFLSNEVNLAIEIGVIKPPERKIVIEIIAEMKSKNPNLQNMQLLTLINQELASKNISYRLPISLVSSLESISQKSLGINLGIVNLKFLAKQPLLKQIEAHIEKYINKTMKELKSLTASLDNVLNRMTSIASNSDIMQETAIEILLKIGYLKVGIENKDPGQLANIIFNEMVAAEGCLVAKTKKGLEEVSKDEAIDQVAIILVNALK